MKNSKSVQSKWEKLLIYMPIKCIYFIAICASLAVAIICILFCIKNLNHDNNKIEYIILEVMLILLSTAFTYFKVLDILKISDKFLAQIQQKNDPLILLENCEKLCKPNNIFYKKLILNILKNEGITYWAKLDINKNISFMVLDKRATCVYVQTYKIDDYNISYYFNTKKELSQCEFIECIPNKVWKRGSFPQFVFEIEKNLGLSYIATLDKRKNVNLIVKNRDNEIVSEWIITDYMEFRELFLIQS